MPFETTRHANKFRQQLRAEYKEANTPCYLCGQPIDYTAPANHPNSLEIDHIIPTSKAPHLMYEANNLRPAHMSCNRAKSNNNPQPTLGTPSEQW